jgi:hypothetical protein
MTYEHRERRRRQRIARHYARGRRRRDAWERSDPGEVLACLEEHRRDVEEYLADLSERIRRLQDEAGVSARPEASPEPS